MDYKKIEKTPYENRNRAMTGNFRALYAPRTHDCILHFFPLFFYSILYVSYVISSSKELYSQNLTSKAASPQRTNES
jgi:hypothetical protein